MDTSTARAKGRSPRASDYAVTAPAPVIAGSRTTVAPSATWPFCPQVAIDSRHKLSGWLRTHLRPLGHPGVAGPAVVRHLLRRSSGEPAPLGTPHRPRGCGPSSSAGGHGGLEVLTPAPPSTGPTVRASREGHSARVVIDPSWQPSKQEQHEAPSLRDNVHRTRTRDCLRRQHRHRCRQ